MIARILSLGLLVLLAGCLDAGPGGSASLDGADAPREDGGQPDAEEAAETPEQAAGPAPAPAEEAFAWRGHVGTWAFACAVVTCQGIGTATENTEVLSGVVRVQLHVDWSMPNELAVGIARGCDDGCDFVAWNSGGPGLELEADGLDPDEDLLLVVWHPYRGAGPAGAQVGPQTEFDVEGTLWVA